MILQRLTVYKIFKYVKNKLLYPRDVVIGYNVRIGRGSVFEGANKVRDNSYFNGRMGYGSYISQDCDIDANIGRFSSIAAKVCVVSGIHPLGNPYVSTSPYFYSISSDHADFTFASKQLFTEHKYADEKTRTKVIIGSDCWIGYDAVLISGVKISDGAVVLARAVVTKDVPPYAIVGGVPARIIGYRYEHDVILKLLNRKWWNSPVNELRMCWEQFSDIEAFLKDI